MIFDRLKNAKKYYKLNEKLKKGFEFLANSDLLNLKDGRYEIDGNNIFANVQTLSTKSKSQAKWEAHRKYIDIQYLIKGRECMGYGMYEDFKDVVQQYDKDKDLEFKSGGCFNYIDIQEGDFVIFYPEDMHAPMLYSVESEEIKKVIVKVAI